MKVAWSTLIGKDRLLRPEFSLHERVRATAAVPAGASRGSVVALARRDGISRQTASGMVKRARDACEPALAPGVPGRPARTDSILVDQDRIRSAVVALAVEGHTSISGMQAFLEVILGRHVATGSISTILREAATRAHPAGRADGRAARLRSHRRTL